MGVGVAVAEVVFASRFATAISWITSARAAANAIGGRCSAGGSLMPSLGGFRRDGLRQGSHQYHP